MATQKNTNTPAAQLADQGTSADDGGSHINRNNSQGNHGIIASSSNPSAASFLNIFHQRDYHAAGHGTGASSNPADASSSASSLTGEAHRNPVAAHRYEEHQHLHNGYYRNHDDAGNRYREGGISFYHSSTGNEHRQHYESEDPQRPAYEQEWAEACSICFHNRCDFSFPKCQDQFCRSCINKYFTEKIRSCSWGLTSLTLTCPVCYDEIADEVVGRYVDESSYQMYMKHKNPQRNLTRYCPECEEECAVAGNIPTDPSLVKHNKQDFALLMKMILSEGDTTFDNFYSRYSEFLEMELKPVLDKEANSFREVHSFYNYFIELCQKGIEACDQNGGYLSTLSSVCSCAQSDVMSSSCSAPFIHEQLLRLTKGVQTRSAVHHLHQEHERFIGTSDSEEDLTSTKRKRPHSRERGSKNKKTKDNLEDSILMDSKIIVSKSMYFTLSMVSRRLINHVTDGFKRLQLQFCHLQYFPFVSCSKCNGKYCLQCSEGAWHEVMTCEEHMKVRIKKLLRLTRPMSNGGNQHTDQEKPFTFRRHTLSPRREATINFPPSNHKSDGLKEILHKGHSTLGEHGIRFSEDDFSRKISKKLGKINAASMTPSQYKQLVDKILSQELRSLQWKAANSKRCPNCQSFIERDDGCNKMDCLYCGYAYCWHCLKPWSTKCGFYSCQMSDSNTHGEGSSSKSKEETLVGAEGGSKAVVLFLDAADALSGDNTSQQEFDGSRNTKKMRILRDGESRSTSKTEIGVPDVLEIFEKTGGKVMGSINRQLASSHHQQFSNGEDGDGEGSDFW
eukprot:Nk52_evm36s272 gene=Nk52_evmTU36s272